jgi:hypothetical protein
VFASNFSSGSFRGSGLLECGDYFYSESVDDSDEDGVVVGESTSANGFEAFR